MPLKGPLDCQKIQSLGPTTPKATEGDKGRYILYRDIVKANVVANEIRSDN